MPDPNNTLARQPLMRSQAVAFLAEQIVIAKLLAAAQVAAVGEKSAPMLRAIADVRNTLAEVATERLVAYAKAERLIVDRDFVTAFVFAQLEVADFTVLPSLAAPIADLIRSAAK